MNVRPLHDRIIVRRIEEGEQTVAGIIIPDSAKDKPLQGKVIAAGNGKLAEHGARVPLDVKVGDLIIFGKYSGQEIKLQGEDYLIMRDDKVLSVIDPAPRMKGASARVESRRRKIGLNVKLLSPEDLHFRVTPSRVVADDSVIAEIKNVSNEVIESRLAATKDRLGSRAWLL